MKVFLHVGCGPQSKTNTTNGFNTPEWREIRLDIDESVRPDVIGTMTDMSQVPDASVDAIFSSHNIEHLYPHEVPLALSEFWRVLKDDGFVVITCPDLQSLCQLVVDDKLNEPAYISAGGPIAPMDVLYGWRTELKRGKLYMAHRCGFTAKVLMQDLQSSNFKTVACMSRPEFFDLWALATKSKTENKLMEQLVEAHFPLQSVVFETASN